MDGDLALKVERFIKEEGLLQPGDGIVTAVSGGPDSVALLHLLFSLSERWRFRLIAAHVNHGFRGEESREEAEFVKELARRLGIPCETIEIDVPSYIEETGKNAQLAAREQRYAFLLETAYKHGANRVALAHHADDQAETVLMRVLRGASPAGLSGIPLRRMEKNSVELIRPLLRIYKSDLVQYCEQRGLAYRIDSSNLKTKYFRNQVRIELMPLLERYNDKLAQALNRLADMAAAEDEYMQAETKRLYASQVRAAEGVYRLSAAAFAAVPVALQRRLIKLILCYLGADGDSADYAKIEELRVAAMRPGPPNIRLEAGAGIALTREYDMISFHRMKLSPSAYTYSMTAGDRLLVIPETGVTLHMELREASGVSLRPADEAEALFDLGKVKLPLTVRSRKPGDRMKVLGLNGTKKVKDMFIDAKVPPSIRQLVPVVEDASGTVLWLPGVRRAAAAPVTEQTEALLHLKVCMPDRP